jgi:hypothetical protein
MQETLLRRIIATTTFGDGGQQATKEKPIYNSPVGPIPVWPPELDGKIRFNCVKGDLTCTPGGSSTLAHMQYGGGNYIPESARFIQTQLQKVAGTTVGAGGGSGDTSAVAKGGKSGKGAKGASARILSEPDQRSPE